MPFLSYPEQIGFDRGRNAAKSDREQSGKRPKLLRAIQAVLNLVHGSPGLELLPMLEQRNDEAFFKQFFLAMMTTNSLEDLDALLAEPSNP
jgi:hypothetical protein